MSKLLQEASLDDEFNAQMDKIQQAIIKLEKLAKRFNYESQPAPVRTQFRMLQAASNDLDSLARTMFGEEQYRQLMK